MRHNRFLQSGLIILAAVLLGYFNLPGETQKQIFPLLPAEFYQQKISLGLDLQGGSQLDYKVDLRNVPEKDRSKIIEGIINVIQKRVNGLGVSEPNIYASKVGDENHIIVELAGIKDLEKAKETVGKTIQLEFKEKRETADPEYAKKVKAEAEKSMAEIKKTDFKIFGEEAAQANPGKVAFTESEEFLFKDQLPPSIAEQAFTLKAGEIFPTLIESSGEYTLDPNGGITQVSGYNIVKVLERQNADKQINEPRQVKTAQILVSYKDAPGFANNSKETLAPESKDLTRTKEEAKARAEEALAKLNNTSANPTPSFEELVKQYSDHSSKNANGVMETAVTEDSQDYVKEYAKAAFALQKNGDRSAVVESPMGFHIIKAVEITEAVNKTVKEDQIKFARLFYNKEDDMWENTELNGKYFQRADVQFDQLYQPNVSISFNAEGAKLFEQLTEKNINKPIAIFVGGNLISAPNVSEKIIGGKAVINGTFSIKEAETLARDLNTGAIPAPIILVGQYNIGASLGQDALTKSLNAGLIGLAMIALFMLVYYRWAGLVATVALFFYTVTLIFLIKSSLPLPLSLGIAMLVFGYLIYRILGSKESGPEKLIALILACFILFFMTFVLSSPIVMTLAGIAGVILSIGMAVDANILIFERIKEEIRDGRPMDSAVKVGFERAWSSIKDSNFSSLITCAILFYFGSSIIQGFAFNLAAGILVSMFSAISITRILLTALLQTKLGQNLAFFGTPKKAHKLLPIIPRRKILYSISLVTIVLSIISLLTIGLKPSLDFTGGSLMELKFQTPISTTDLSNSLHQIQDKINQSRTTSATPEKTSDTNKDQTNLQNQQGKLDLGSIHIVTSNDDLVVKSRDISAADHDLILQELRAKHGEVEEKRFQSVGPTIGESLRYRAIMAVIIASLAIILYIAFAFRKVPVSVGKWKFGVSAIIALLHDVVVLIGIYVVLGLTMGLEIDALFITAILTVMGFSIHDTIVVLDRLREKLKAPAKDKTFEELTNEAVNETFARSINTSLTACLSLLALVIFGAESIRGFNLALLIGIAVGTYSSIFIASPILVDWYIAAHKKANK
jgi:SecD/SecF fusion protein